jgi:hypothetical protein
MANEEQKTAPTEQPEKEQNLFKAAVENKDMATKVPEAASQPAQPASDDEDDEVISTKGFSKKEKSEFVREYEKIGMDEPWPDEGRILTIEMVYPQAVKKSDKPIENDNGAYYKKKLMVCFAESREVTIDGEKLNLKYREPIPSVFYGFVDGKVTEPRIPKACEKDDLTDNFTASTAKMRYKFFEAFPETNPKQSDFDYTETLKGKKVLVKKEVGKWKDGGQVKKYCKLVIENFVK